MVVMLHQYVVMLVMLHKSASHHQQEVFAQPNIKRE